MLEDKDIYSSIVKDFQLSSSILETIISEVEALTKARRDLCKLFKITVFSYETIDIYVKEFIRDIDDNNLQISGYEKKQIELKDKLKVYKKEIKMIKLHITKLEEKIISEQILGKKLNVNLRIFLKREKFKFIKKIIFKSYRKVFFGYYNQMSIKIKIDECNKRKDKIRFEKQKINNSLEKYKRKIIMDRITLSQMRKSIINKQKRIEILNIKLKTIEDYKQVEEKFKIKLRHLKNN